MLTVAEALELPILEQARAVAGRGGLAREIRWVHTISVPDAADWLHGGELALTTMFNLPDEPAAQCDFIRRLADKGIVAVVITIGSLLDSIPDYLRRLGDELDLPLIELSYETRFVDIAKTINERIAEKNLDRANRALDIQRRLSHLVLEGGGFQELAEMLAEMVGHSISIEDERFEAIANKNIAEVDSARRYTMLHGRTNPRLIDALEDDYLPKIRESRRPVYLPVMPAVGLEMERLLAPIVVHNEIYGYMWIIADLHALSQIDMMAVEIGAAVAALLMLHHTAEASRKDGLIAQLIDGEVILSHQTRRYGLDLRRAWQMMLISAEGGRLPYAGGSYRVINQALHERPAVAAQFAGQTVILIQAGQDADALAEKLLARLVDEKVKARIGISAVFKGAANVSAAYQQCSEILDIAQRIGGRAVQRFADLGYIHTLLHAGREGMEQNPYVPVLRRLLGEKANLFHTLETYLDVGGSSVQTAAALHIHRSTLNYRLARIGEICQVDLSSPGVRVNLQVALKLIRLFDGG